MVKKKILFITAFPPNNKTAGQNYTLQLLEDISSLYEIDLIYWDYPSHEYSKVNNVHIYKVQKLSKIKSLINLLLFPLFPLFTRRFDLLFALKLRNIAKHYDIVYFDFSQTFAYSLFIKHPNKISMSHDVISQKYSRQKFGKSFIKWVDWSEKVLLKTFNARFTFSNKDKEIIHSKYGLSSNVVTFYLDKKILSIKIEDVQEENYFVMYGAWNRPENQESLNWVLSEYDESYNIKIIGGGMPSIIKDRLNNYRNIEYLGFVMDPYPIIAKSKGLIAPLFHGAGVKVKAVETLALGTRVIGTNVTFEGLPCGLTGNGELCYLIENYDDLKNDISEISSSVGDKKRFHSLFIQNYQDLKFKDYIS